MTHRATSIVLLVVLGIVPQAYGQAPINSDVALQPSTGGFIFREKARLLTSDDINTLMARSTLVYGYSDGLTFLFSAPYVYTEMDTASGSDREEGFADFSLLTKPRLYRDDFGPTDTMRFDLIAGMDVPSGDDPLASDSVSPVLGGVFTYVEGRRAFDADLLWKFNTEGDGVDAMRYDLAYLHRLMPDDFSDPPYRAIYSVLELNGRYETNGDHELFISPGIQWVTKRWIVEMSVSLPIVQELDHRLEYDVALTWSIRWQF